jgi:hypothetical protein
MNLLAPICLQFYIENHRRSNSKEQDRKTSKLLQKTELCSESILSIRSLITNSFFQENSFPSILANLVYVPHAIYFGSSTKLFDFNSYRFSQSRHHIETQYKASILSSLASQIWNR